MLLGGRLGDAFGRKRMFIAGVALFTVASLLCGLAVNEATLIARAGPAGSRCRDRVADRVGAGSDHLRARSRA